MTRRTITLTFYARETTAQTGECFIITDNAIPLTANLIDPSLSASSPVPYDLDKRFVLPTQCRLRIVKAILNTTYPVVVTVNHVLDYTKQYTDAVEPILTLSLPAPGSLDYDLDIELPTPTVAPFASAGKSITYDNVTATPSILNISALSVTYAFPNTPTTPQTVEGQLILEVY